MDDLAGLLKLSKFNNVKRDENQTHNRKDPLTKRGRRRSMEHVVLRLLWYAIQNIFKRFYYCRKKVSILWTWCIFIRYWKKKKKRGKIKETGENRRCRRRRQPVPRIDHIDHHSPPELQVGTLPRGGNPKAIPKVASRFVELYQSLADKPTPLLLPRPWPWPVEVENMAIDTP